MSKSLKEKLGPELYDHHHELHTQLAKETHRWNKMLTEDKDYICHKVIQNVKDYNELVANKIQEHNRVARDLCAEKNITYRPLKNNYVIPVPEIGDAMKPKYCQCDDEHDEAAVDISCDTCAAKSDYCQCESQEPRSLITSVLQPQKSRLPVLDGMKTITISEDMIPDEYKELFTKSN